MDFILIVDTSHQITFLSFYMNQMNADFLSLTFLKIPWFFFFSSLKREQLFSTDFRSALKEQHWCLL